MATIELNKVIRDKLSELLTSDCYQGYQLQLDRLAKKLSLSIFDATFADPDLSGAIYRDEQTGNFNIYANERHPITRKRFTIAHEVGHYISAICGSHSKDQLLKSGEGLEDYAVSYRYDGIKSEVEIEANQIAAEMLMPQEWVKKLVREGMSIEQMAQMFFVSEQAISIRVNSFGIDIL
jgi:Zn-dependent peptidase ImmA (M78 family)